MVGGAIPQGFLDPAVLAQFYSDEYARIVAMVDTEVEGDRAFGLVDQINAEAASRYDEFYTAGSLRTSTTWRTSSRSTTSW